MFADCLCINYVYVLHVIMSHHANFLVQYNLFSKILSFFPGQHFEICFYFFTEDRMGKIGRDQPPC